MDYKSTKVSNLTTKAAVYTVPNEKTSCLISFFIANKTNNVASVSVSIRSGGTDYYLISELPLPARSTVQPSDGKKIFMTQGEILYIESNEEVDIIMSYIEGIQ